MEAAERQALFAGIEREARAQGWYGLTPARPGGEGNSIPTPVVAALVAAMVVPIALRIFLVDEGATLGEHLDGVGGTITVVVLFIGLCVVIAMVMRNDRTAPIERRPALALEKRAATGVRADGVVLLEEADGSQTEYHAHDACFERIDVPTPGFAYVAHHRLLDFKPVAIA